MIDEDTIYSPLFFTLVSRLLVFFQKDACYSYKYLVELRTTPNTKTNTKYLFLKLGVNVREVRTTRPLPQWYICVHLGPDVATNGLHGD